MDLTWVVILSQSCLILFLTNFEQTFGSGTNGTCNNGAIVGQSLPVEGNNYTSQLAVTVTPDIAGKTIKCLYDNGTAETILFSWVIPAIGPFSPPNGLKFSNIDFSLRELTFSWSPVTPDRPPIHYKTLASNRGSCPTTTNHTTVTCTDVPNNCSTTCTFAVQTVTCGNLAGNVSEPITITFYPQGASTDSPHLTENVSIYNSNTTETVDIQNLDTNTAVYTISIGSLATSLFISIVVFIIVIIIILKRSKAKIKAALQLSNRAGETVHDVHDEPMYEDVTEHLSSCSHRH